MVTIESVVYGRILGIHVRSQSNTLFTNLLLRLKRTVIVLALLVECRLYPHVCKKLNFKKQLNHLH